MATQRQSDIFKNNFTCWKIFGLWPGRSDSKYYKYYTFFYLFITFFAYNILLTLNLVYTPRTIEFILREVIFYFTEIAVTSKILMIVIMRDKIIEALNLLDSQEMGGYDENSKKQIDQNYNRFQIYWNLYVVISNIAFMSQVLIPILLNLLYKSGLELPICKYYFLTDEVRENYFVFWFIYQSFGMYGHMMYNVSIDSFIAGLLLIAVVQCKILRDNFHAIKLSTDEKTLKFQIQEKIQMARLKKCLKRYDFLLNYCKTVQDFFDATMFVQFGMSSVIICVVMCGFLLPSSSETYVFMVMYFIAMTGQIFIPGFLGTHLSYKSQELVLAAFNTEWIERSESFKRSIRIFVERANTPIQMSGLKMFPLSLTTFISIMKSAYSFFTLIRNFQNK